MKRAKSTRPKTCPYVSKGGLKLEFALDYFHVDVKDKIIIDLGSHVGGFVDCLLKRNAKLVYSVDTAYGILDWRLRNDKRVVVNERKNVLYWHPPELSDIVTIDLGWTRQKLILPVATRFVKEGGIILSLVKPQYELEQHGKKLLKKGVLPPEALPAILDSVKKYIPRELQLVDEQESPIKGSGGNTEAWLLLKRQAINNEK